MACSLTKRKWMKSSLKCHKYDFPDFKLFEHNRKEWNLIPLEWKIYLRQSTWSQLQPHNVTIFFVCFFRISNYISKTHSHTIYIFFFYISLCLYLYPFVLLTFCISSLPSSTYWSMCLLESMHVAVLIYTFHHMFLFVKVLVRIGGGEGTYKTVIANPSKNKSIWVQKSNGNF